MAISVAKIKHSVGLLALWLAVWKTIVHLQGKVAVSAAQLELVRPFYNAHVVMRLSYVHPVFAAVLMQVAHP
jgi:hypothetical protein